MGSTVTAVVEQVHVHALETEGGVVGAGPAFDANISVLCVCVCGGEIVIKTYMYYSHTL